MRAEHGKTISQVAAISPGTQTRVSLLVSVAGSGETGRESGEKLVLIKEQRQTPLTGAGGGKTAGCHFKYTIPGRDRV